MTRIGVLVILGKRHRAVHGRRGHQGGCNELVVPHLLPADRDRTDEVAETDAHRQQIEQRLEESAEQEDPLAAIGNDVAFDHPLWPANVSQHRRKYPQDRGHAYNLRRTNRNDSKVPATLQPSNTAT